MFETTTQWTFRACGFRDSLTPITTIWADYSIGGNFQTAMNFAKGFLGLFVWLVRLLHNDRIPGYFTKEFYKKPSNSTYDWFQKTSGEQNLPSNRPVNYINWIEIFNWWVICFGNCFSKSIDILPTKNMREKGPNCLKKHLFWGAKTGHLRSVILINGVTWAAAINGQK